MRFDFSWPYLKPALLSSLCIRRISLLLFLLLVDLSQMPLGLDMVENLEMLAAVELTLASGQKLISNCARHWHHAILGCLLLP